jgi:glutathione S-transferase
MPRLIALPFSPWSEKAKWALDHHGIRYEYEEHVPFIGELKLRILLRRPRGLVTVPVLCDGSSWLTDSFDIARYAEQAGSGPRLFPAGKDEEIKEWNRRSEEALAAGRAIAVLGAASDPAAALGDVPPPLRPLLGRIARLGISGFIAKYHMREGADQHERVLSDALTALESALAGRGGCLIGDSLSYADIAMAVVLQFVAPVDKKYMPAAPPGVRSFRNEKLASRYQGLLAWRDELYAKHRQRTS